MKLNAILFDTIGTTIIEKDAETVINSLSDAFNSKGLSVDREFLRHLRGKDKRGMIAAAVEHQSISNVSVEDIYDSFTQNILCRLENFTLNPSLNGLFQILRKKDIKIGLGSGLPKDLLAAILEQANFDLSQLSYIGTPNERIRSRPYPDMIFDMMNKLSLKDKNKILKVGDTLADIEEGKQAGVLTAVVLSGTQDKQSLLKAKPDFVLNSLDDLGSII